MTIKVDVRADTKAMLRDLSTVQKKIAPKSSLQAMNRAIQRVRTETINGVTGAFAIKPKRIISERLFNIRATMRRLSAVMRADWQPVPVIQMLTTRQRSAPPTRRRTGRGKRKGGISTGPYHFPQAFLAYRGSASRFSVYQRLTARRFPIQKVTIALLPAADTIAKKAVATVGADTWRREFARIMTRKLKRKHG